MSAGSENGPMQPLVAAWVMHVGAGKTTLIKHILGLLRAETGEVRVLMINHGRIVLSGPLDTIKQANRVASLDEIFTANAGVRLTPDQ